MSEELCKQSYFSNFISEGIVIGVLIESNSKVNLLFLYKTILMSYQNHNEVPLHASQDGCYPKVYKQLLQLNSRKINEPMKKWAKELNRQFSKEDIHIANKHMKTQHYSLSEKCKSKPQ